MSDDHPLVMMLSKAARAEAERQQPFAPMSHMAAAMELQAAWKLTQQPRTVHVGLLCQERDGLGTMNGIPTGSPLMLWRMLDPDVPYDWEIIADAVKHRWAHRYDCLIGARVPDGHIHTFPHETWRLEPYTGPREAPEAA